MENLDDNDLILTIELAKQLDVMSHFHIYRMIPNGL
jgi:hypothetical protein